MFLPEKRIAVVDRGRCEDAFAVKSAGCESRNCGRGGIADLAVERSKVLHSKLPFAYRRVPFVKDDLSRYDKTQ